MRRNQRRLKSLETLTKLSQLQPLVKFLICLQILLTRTPKSNYFLKRRRAVNNCRKIKRMKNHRAGTTSRNLAQWSHFSEFLKIKRSEIKSRWSSNALVSSSCSNSLTIFMTLNMNSKTRYSS